MSLKMKIRKLSFSDLLFISFGGQAPFISLLTFGTIMIILVGTEGALAMIIATLIVLFNGLVIYFLSKRFKRGGGYYVYAFYSLTSRLGLNTGWNYILYSISYGGTLLAGGAYVLYLIFNSFFYNYLPSIFLQQWFIALIISILACSLMLAGIRASAVYAMIMSLAEMFAMISLSIFFLYDSHWNFYNPISYQISSKLLAAVIFGLGIPTGYGSIAPLAKEAEEKAIGKAGIAALLLGGLLATFFFYSLAAMNFTGDLVKYLLGRFGIIGLLAITFIAINDGTLGGMAYLLSSSRTIKAMAEDRFFPYFLSKETKNGKPLFSELFTSAIFMTVLSLSAYFVGIFNTFIIFGALAGLNNIFIHVSANVSLIRIASKRIRKHYYEIIIAVIATIISFATFFYSLPSFNRFIVYTFLGWIILGFLYAEGLEMLKAGSEEER